MKIKHNKKPRECGPVYRDVFIYRIELSGTKAGCV
jgi:hypothetical protein